MTVPPDLTKLSQAEKDALILALLEQLAAAHERIAAQDVRIAVLEARLDELFSLSISEGAISNILSGAREPLLDATAAIEKVVLASTVACSDETSVRVNGKNWWEWVFVTALAVLHVTKRSRGRAVVTVLFGKIRPEVWVSDMPGGQFGHAGQ